jgi:hypothetical protein
MFYAQRQPTKSSQQPSRRKIFKLKFRVKKKDIKEREETLPMGTAT